MKVAVGDKIVWFHDAADPSTIRSGTVTRVSADLCWVNDHHKPEDCIYQDFTWPGRVEDELRNVLADRAHLKKVFNDSMKLVYELRNKIVRGEL